MTQLQPTDALTVDSQVSEAIQAFAQALFDLFLDAFPHMIDLIVRGEAKPPLVFIGDDQGHLGELLSAGERISGPAIRRRIEALRLAAKLEPKR